MSKRPKAESMREYAPDGLRFYEAHAAEYAASTTDLDLKPLYERFLALLPPGGHILDAGCGSGRDAVAFSDRGYRVTAFDGAAAIVREAQNVTGLEIQHRTFDDIHEVAAYDGVWACASLVHLPPPERVRVLKTLLRALKPGGVLYVSLKHGRGSVRAPDGRHFVLCDVKEFNADVDDLSEARVGELWLSSDPRNNGTTWLNALIMREQDERR